MPSTPTLSNVYYYPPQLLSVSAGRFSTLGGTIFNITGIMLVQKYLVEHSRNVIESQARTLVRLDPLMSMYVYTMNRFGKS
jgi:hypothetical protein